MNIGYEKMINSLDDREDNFRSYFQKLLILRVVQQCFCEISVSGIKIAYTDSFFEATNIRKSVKNDSSEFEGLLHEMMYKKPFIDQEISCINFDGERKLSTVSNYMKEFLSIIEI